MPSRAEYYAMGNGVAVYTIAWDIVWCRGNYAYSSGRFFLFEGIGVHWCMRCMRVPGNAVRCTPCGDRLMNALSPVCVGLKGFRISTVLQIRLPGVFCVHQ